MAKATDREVDEITNTLRAYEQEAIQMVTRAFNEGYLLGIEYGRMVMGDEKNEN